MKNNHFVSQLIMRRFSETINSFQFNKKEPDSNVKSKNIFFERGIFSDENETRMNESIEGPVAQLLDNKIIDKDIIEINREDLYLLKRYFLLDSIRTQYERFDLILSGFSSNALRYKTTCFVEGISLDHLMLMSDLNLTNQELLDLSIKIVTESKSFNDIVFHKGSFLEIVCWSKPFFDAFITFWDSDDEEFILTDNGMTTEYETSHQIYSGLDLSKISYLSHRFSETENKDWKLYLSTLISKYTLFYENFSIFNISANRLIVIANPFFRLFSENGHKFFSLSNPDDMLSLEAKIPDIWPSVIQNKSAFNVPKNIYVAEKENSYSDQDRFIYEPCVLEKDEVIYLNYLLLTQTRARIVYNDLNSIIDSLTHYNQRHIEEGYSQYPNKIQAKLKYEAHPISKLIKFARNKGIYPSKDKVGIFNVIVEKQMRDVHENKYICQYVLKNIDTFENVEHHFGFIGTKEEVKKHFQDKYQYLVSSHKRLKI